MDKTFGAGKGRKGKSKKSGTKRPASKFVPAPGEAGGIMEFSFGYDFKKHIKQVDLSKHVIPDPNEIDKEGNVKDGGRPGPNMAGPSTSVEVAGSSTAAVAGPSTSASGTDLMEIDPGTICQKCKAPSLIWVKNVLKFEGKWYAVLIELCRDYQCANITGEMKRTELPAFLSKPELYLPPVLVHKSEKLKAEEAEELKFGKYVPYLVSGDVNEVDDIPVPDPAEEIPKKKWKDPFDDPHIKRLVEYAVKDPTLGLPLCFDKPFDFEGARALNGISEKELWLTLKEMYPDGIPDMLEVLGIE